MNVFRFLKLKKAYQKVCSFIIAVSFLIPPPLSGLNQQPNEEIQKKYGRHR